MDVVPNDKNYLHYNTLVMRYELATQFGLSGIGLWQSDKVTFNNTDPKLDSFAVDMFELFNEYSGKMQPSEVNLFPDDYWLVAMCRKFQDRAPEYEGIMD